MPCSYYECSSVRIKDLGNQKDLVLGNIYRPPHNNNNQININTFVTELDPMLSSLTNNRDDFLIAGDFNINLLQINVVNKEHYAQFLDLMLAYSLFPKITFPTRTSESGSCTLIDNIFCKLSKETLSSIAGILYTSISDHYPYFLSFSRSKNRGNEPPSRYVKQRVDTESARAAYLADLMNSNIISQLDQDPYCDPNVNYDILHKHITDLKDKHLPFKLVKFNKYKHKGNKWITNGVLKSLKYKDRLYKQLRSTDKSSNLYPYLKQKFGLYNSLLKKLIRECKISYYHQQFHDNKSDIKKTWASINEILCKTRKTQGGIKSIISKGKHIDDPGQIVEHFNSFFINIGPSLVSKSTPPKNKNFQMYLNKAILTSFNFTLIDDGILGKTLHSLRTKTSAGHDGISVKLLKYLFPALSKPLCLVINQSLLTGIYPDKLKIAKVIPLFKKDDTLLMDNYRPISLLPSISKLFEKVVSNQVSEYFMKNNLFHDGQYGFRDSHSTELANIELADRIISALDEKQLPVTIYMDLSKAFDTLDHDTLLKKLNYYGISDTALEWFRSYLSHRSQYVELNGVSSARKTITTGVPQGSILGPLLFLIYMNDIPQSSQSFRFILYADDTNLFTTVEYLLPISISNVSEILNNELKEINDWLSLNKLTLNIQKTKFMVFHPYQKDIAGLIPMLKINDVEIERVSSFKCLGILFDENMSWKCHTDMISNKLSKYTGILNKLKHYLPPYILRMLYFSMVNAHLNYGILVWGFVPTRLIKIQKRTIRTITCSKYNAHTEPLFKIMDILRLKDLLDINALKFYYKYLRGTLPSYFYSFNITTQGENHSYNTRQSDQIRTNRTRTHFADNRLKIYLPPLINSVPTTLLQKIATHSIHGFSSSIKRYYIGNYSNTCSIPNCYICQRTWKLLYLKHNKAIFHFIFHFITLYVLMFENLVKIYLCI